MSTSSGKHSKSWSNSLVKVGSFLVVVLWLGVGVALATSLTVVELDTASDITIVSENTSDVSLLRVGVGDLNDDGIQDLIIGSEVGSPDGRLNAGKTFVVFGPILTGSVGLPSGAHLTINGMSTDDRSGS